MRKFLIGCACAALLSTAAQAETPLWLRYVQISPNGNEILFNYKGDIYKVPVGGGYAVQLTTQPTYEFNAVWSADGKSIAFASNRKGNFDIFVMPANGGTAKQLTFNSANETPWAFSPDGKYVYFSAAIQDPASSALFPSGRLTELYKVPVQGGRTTRVLATPAEMVHFAPGGKYFLYHDAKGNESAWRKHHTSSVTRDVWRYDVATGKHTNLTNRAGEDRNPVLSADGKTAYILSERNGGSFNVWQFPIDNPSNAKQVTSFKGNPVRFLSIAANGTLCYAYDGEIYTQQPTGKPKKVVIELIHDDADQISNLTLTRGATSATVSPDGKQVAFIARGDVFVTSVEYNTTKQISNTPQLEAGLSWGADNRSLYYASERNGNWQLVKASIERKEDLNFPNATLVKEEILLPSTTVERAYPDVSPDGKELAFIEDRFKLMVMDLKSKNVRQVTDGSSWYETNGGFGYSWSPDGKWFALEFIGNQRDPYSDIGIVSSKGGKITNITGSAYISESPKWVLDGNAIMFTSNRYGMRSQASWGSLNDVILAFVNQEAYDKYQLNKEDYELLQELEKEQKKEEDKKKEADKKDAKKDDKKDAKKDDKSKDIVMELDGIEHRIVRVTPNSSDIASAMITKDGSSLYYLSAFEKGYDLWKLDLRKHSTQLINKMDSRWANIEMDKDGKNMFILGGNTMKKLTVAGDKLTNITYSGEMKLDRMAEREAMFNHVHKQIQKRFYNLNYHGVNWDALTETYRKFLPHINNNYDFSEMLSEYLGELNVSHTGSGYRPAGAGERTADLGLIYDWNYTGKGLRVAEVIENGPFNKSKSKVVPGTIVEKINGTEITNENDYSLLLNGLTGKKTLVTLSQGGKTWDEVVVPISSGRLSDLLYNRWVKHCAHMVDSLSNGRLGYVHLRSMDDESYRDIYSQILGKYNKREGIVIDTRWNGGGRLHEDIETLFSGEKYLTQVIRGREACDMPSRRWNKPSIMLQCEANYSNAHGTPWVYNYKKMGKLVGMPVPGTMTSVSWETLQDETMYFGIPIIGYKTKDGNYLENTQLEPDIKVANNPETVVNGVDDQLKAAVKELLREIDGK